MRKIGYNYSEAELEAMDNKFIADMIELESMPKPADNPYDTMPTMDDFIYKRMEVQYAIDDYNRMAHAYNRSHKFPDYVPIMADYRITTPYPSDYEPGGKYENMFLD